MGAAHPQPSPSAGASSSRLGSGQVRDDAPRRGTAPEEAAVTETATTDDLGTPAAGASGATGAITPERFARTTEAILASVGSVIDGKPEAVRSALVCLLAEGHLLIE